MKIIYMIIGLSILFLLNFLSILLVSTFKIHFPAPLIGMIILAALIHCKIIPLQLIEESCKLLLKNMSLFFIPLLVGIVVYLNIIAQNAVPILFTILITTVIIISVTGITVEQLITWGKKAKNNDYP